MYDNVTSATGRDLISSASSGYGHCCPAVFDPYTLVALVGGIALVTYFLRVVIITTVFAGKRSFGQDSILTQMWEGILVHFFDIPLREFLSFSVRHIFCCYRSGIL